MWGSGYPHKTPGFKWAKTTEPAAECPNLSLFKWGFPKLPLFGYKTSPQGNAAQRTGPWKGMQAAGGKPSLWRHSAEKSWSQARQSEVLASGEAGKQREKFRHKEELPAD